MKKSQFRYSVQNYWKWGGGGALCAPFLDPPLTLSNNASDKLRFRPPKLYLT